MAKARRLTDLDGDELTTFVREAGQPAFRARQLRTWLWQRGVFDPAAMTDLPAAFREQLATAFSAAPLGVERVEDSDDGTAKLLFRLEDGLIVEHWDIIAPKPAAPAKIWRRYR